jgi:hypothetical protein
MGCMMRSGKQEQGDMAFSIGKVANGMHQVDRSRAVIGC